MYILLQFLKIPFCLFEGTGLGNLFYQRFLETASKKNYVV